MIILHTIVDFIMVLMELPLLLKSSPKTGPFKRIKPTKPTGIAATTLLLPIDFPIALILSAMEPLLLKRGGSTEVYATKECVLCDNKRLYISRTTAFMYNGSLEN